MRMVSRATATFNVAILDNIVVPVKDKINTDRNGFADIAAPGR